jgi:hypothetical protein
VAEQGRGTVFEGRVQKQGGRERNRSRLLISQKKKRYQSKGPGTGDIDYIEDQGKIALYRKRRDGNQCFLSELLVYLKNWTPTLVLLFLTMV